jgi:hypothetical protein
MKAWLALVGAVVVPGAGHVLLGRPMRGLILLFWMIILGYITFQLSSPAVSPIGRFAGGIAVWVLSVVEIWRMTSRARSKN